MKIYTKALSEEESKKKQYYLVDVFKFIGALLIVAIHIAPFSTYNEWINYGIQNYIARVAVPFYFIVSGYFLFRKITYDKFDSKIPLTYAKRIFNLYIIWTIIYMPLIIRDIKANENGILHGIIYWVRCFIFEGSYTHLWYLNATIVATLMLTVCFIKKMKINNIISLGIVLYAIGLLPQTYSVLLQPLRNVESLWTCLRIAKKIIFTTRNGIFEGFLLMGIGMYFAYKPVVMKIKTAITGFGVSTVLLLFEAVIVKCFEWKWENDMYIFMVPAAFFLFYIATHIELEYNPIYKHLRELGMLIFYIHLIVRPFVEKGMAMLGTENSLLQYGGIVAITIVISECVIKVSCMPKFKLLKKVYA